MSLKVQVTIGTALFILLQADPRKITISSSPLKIFLTVPSGVYVTSHQLVVSIEKKKLFDIPST